MHSSGRSTVEFECIQETDLILIHSNKLNYTTLDNKHIARLIASGSTHMHTFLAKDHSQFKRNVHIKKDF